MKMKKIITSAALLAAPAVFAHAGHDHTAWTAGLIHTVAALSIAGAVVLLYKYVKANKQAQQRIEK